ncbi:TPA: radical SAM protein, partial [Streptococcus equi subsp. zooepidemicus]|nr:radical SAM protein [Streptococcus equi subsp. zooepidemicus]
MEMSPYILSTTLSDGKVYYNTKNNHSFFITNELLDKINYDETARTQYLDYLVSLQYHHEEKELERTLAKINAADEKLLEFTILTHGDCNFRCKYCYEKFENISMTIEVEEAIVEFAEKLLSEGKFERFSVQWFGGEPLLGYRTIVRLSEKFLELCSRYDIGYFSGITTNGYLLTRRRFQNLIENCKVTSYQITVDGEKKFHDNQRLLKNGAGSYDRILLNLKMMAKSSLPFQCTIRFNISKENAESMEAFLRSDGLLFKEDSRYSLAYHNIGDWGQGERSDDYCVDIPDDDLSYYFSKQAISLGYNISSPKTMMLNSINCYANRECHYMFNVKGIVQSCTVALYRKENIFGSILAGDINEKKRKDWIKGIEYDRCSQCPYVLLCKSGYCPLVRLNQEKTWERLCQLYKERIQKD